MSNVLIHANNSALLNSSHFSLDRCVLFEPDPEKDIDQYITEFITEQILPKDPSVIFIKYALTDNYISFLGLRLALHFRLSECSKRTAIPIIMLGEETLLEISKLSDMYTVVATPGIYHSKESMNDITVYIDKISQNQLKGLNNWKDFFSKINILPPSNYDSHHSITNDWSLVRWSEFLGIKAIKKTESEINSSLYYKYNNALLPINPAKNKKIDPVTSSGNILIIDDEILKGWDSIFIELFSQNTLVNIIPFDYDFKGKESKTIISDCMKVIKSEDPDLIILDLRLCDSDYYSPELYKSLTGFGLLKEIKNYNKGLQTIIISASNKIWNYNHAIDFRVDGYILKESPENSRDPFHTEITLKKINSTISQCLERKYLKEIANKIVKINEHFKNKLLIIQVPALKAETKTFLSEISNFINIFFDSFNRKQKYTGDAFYLLFIIIEIINNDTIDVSSFKKQTNGKYKWMFSKHSNYYLKNYGASGTNIVARGDLYTSSSNIPWDQKIYNTAIELGVSISQLNQLSKLLRLRHDFIHQDLSNGLTIPTVTDTKELFDIVYDLCIKL